MNEYKKSKYSEYIQLFEIHEYKIDKKNIVIDTW